jgi:acyl-CoA synthetase (AMP-forming)/AMP-acid ligase II
MRFLDAGRPSGDGPEVVFTGFPEAALNRPIMDRFQEIASRFPRRVAIDDQAASLRYDDLDRLTRRIAGSVTAAIGARRAGAASSR